MIAGAQIRFELLIRTWRKAINGNVPRDYRAIFSKLFVCLAGMSRSILQRKQCGHAVKRYIAPSNEAMPSHLVCEDLAL